MRNIRKPALLSSVLFRGLVEDIPQAIYFPINSEMVREAASKTKGSAGGGGMWCEC